MGAAPSGTVVKTYRPAVQLRPHAAQQGSQVAFTSHDHHATAVHPAPGAISGAAHGGGPPGPRMPQEGLRHSWRGCSLMKWRTRRGRDRHATRRRPVRPGSRSDHGAGQSEAGRVSSHCAAPVGWWEARGSSSSGRSGRGTVGTAAAAAISRSSASGAGIKGRGAGGTRSSTGRSRPAGCGCADPSSPTAPRGAPRTSWPVERGRGRGAARAAEQPADGSRGA